ncbi:hypothetical protein PVAND_015670 [Polypedilum vanderplanki]|uniref:MADF domain-containing protein n=1 Tax=Polypedilum vanderplanki TaxID=319348 RepID=A0A9J6BDV2_POLVA|nr:hypothetical protein PVAND_015670 [Polypedilum vanderplanki]
MIKFRVKDEGPHIDDENLIELVREHQFLYDTRSPDYRNLPMRATVWAEIAKNLAIEDQNIVQKRWKVLREKFSVAYRKYVLDEINPSWVLYDSLTFLEPFVNLKPDNKKSLQSDDTITKYEPTVSKSPLDEHYLIKLIKERPVLYDKKHEDFRIADSRKKAWMEIAEIVGWNESNLQKRWRVIRDRFVRELRRTKNADNDIHINCSPFFREMLFLTHHVRSKNYEVEAHFDSNEDDNSKEYEYEWHLKEESSGKIEILSENVEQVNEDQNYEHLEEVEFEEETILEEVEYPNENEYIEHIVVENDNQNEEKISDNEINDEDVQYEAIVQRDLSEAHEPIVSMHKKRRVSNENQEQQQSIKTKRRATETSQTISNDTADEDVAFANTLGCMLKKIPQHLKTSIKLKLLQSFAEFEAQHKLG